MTFDRDLLLKESKSAIYASKTAGRIVEYFMIFTLRINIENADDQSKVIIVNFKLNDFVIFVERNRLN
jgi:hypothetical protein